MTYWLYVSVIELFSGELEFCKINIFLVGGY